MRGWHSHSGFKFALRILLTTGLMIGPVASMAQGDLQEVIRKQQVLIANEQARQSRMREVSALLRGMLKDLERSGVTFTMLRFDDNPKDECMVIAGMPLGGWWAIGIDPYCGGADELLKMRGTPRLDPYAPPLVSRHDHARIRAELVTGLRISMGPRQ
jgi:hypothetical protein